MSEPFCNRCGGRHLTLVCPLSSATPTGEMLPVRAPVYRAAPIVSGSRFELQPGSTVGEYQVIRKIGSGAMGVVYEGRHPLIERSVAIKVISAELSGSADAAGRLIQEARASNRVHHRNLVDVYSIGALPAPDARLYLVMEFLQGMNLQQLLEERGPLGFEEAQPIIDQVLQGLGAAHQAGVIHRDLKPENIFVLPDPDGASLAKAEVKILDFGLAKDREGSKSSVKTNAGVPMGTPAFMSPEQCRGNADLTPRSDLYSLGIILYWIFTGRLPFDAASYLDTLQQQLSTPPEPPSMYCDMPHALEEIILRLLEKDSTKRFPTAESVRMALKVCDEARTWVPGPPRRQRSPSEAMAAAAAEAAAAEIADSLSSKDAVMSAFSSHQSPTDSEREEPRNHPWLAPVLAFGGAAFFVFMVMRFGGAPRTTDGTEPQPPPPTPVAVRPVMPPPLPAPPPKVAPLPGVVVKPVTPVAPVVTALDKRVLPSDAAPPPRPPGFRRALLGKAKFGKLGVRGKRGKKGGKLARRRRLRGSKAKPKA